MMRKLIWEALFEKRSALIRELEAAAISPEFTEEDMQEWEEIYHALSYTPTPPHD